MFNLRGRDYTCAGAGLDPRIECLDPSDTHNGKEHGNYRGLYGGSTWIMENGDYYSGFRIWFRAAPASCYDQRGHSQRQLKSVSEHEPSLGIKSRKHCQYPVES